MFTDVTIRNLSDAEYLHYAYDGFIPGVTKDDVDALELDGSGYGMILRQARRTLVEHHQQHASDIDKILAVQRCA